MKLAIMQPYFFPYLGYFHLIKAVDKFVLYDDVNFINRGWINRNRVPINDEAHYFTIPLKNASQNSKINSIDLAEQDIWKKKMIKTFQTVYSKSPNRDAGLDLLSAVLNFPTNKLSEICARSIFEVTKYLNIKTQLVPSSTIYSNSEKKAESRILDICSQESASEYINLIGGVELYREDSFQEIGCDLSFIKSELPLYKQNTKEFIKGLSILDIIMNCSHDEIQKMMGSYRVLKSNEIKE